jgi:crotonobetainyl-CoA:carnitine CoA-transferase CaiB-like acyl-CoA transferase
VTAELERPPYESYVAIVGAFAGLLAAGGALGRLLGRDPHCQTSLDFAVLAAASFKAARTLAHDRVTAPVRAPFVEGEADAQNEQPVRDGGMQQAIGELVTCTRCIGTWAAAGLASTQIVAPRFGRLLTWSLASAGINDFLQAAFAALTETANVLEEEEAPLSRVPRARPAPEPLESTG